MEKKVCPLKISIMIVARGINRPTAINIPVHDKIWIHTRDILFLQVHWVCCMNLTFAAIYDYWIQIKARNQLSPFLHVKHSVDVRCPGKKCLLKNCSPFRSLPQFKSGTEISERQTWNFLFSFPTTGQLQFLPTGWGKTMAPGSLLSQTSMAFTYNLVQWINTHAKKGEGIHCISFILYTNPICSQATNILLHSINYPKVKYHVNKRVGKKQQM